MSFELIKDKDKLYSFFTRNKCLYSYQIGDLDDFFFKDTDYFALLDKQSKEILEVGVLYKGLNTPTLLAFGLTETFALLLDQMREYLPEKFYCHYLPMYEKKLLESYDKVDLGLHYKMHLTSGTHFEQQDSSKFIQLRSKHQKELEEFFKESYPETYFEPYMVDTGYYFGLTDSTSKIISVAGVHTFSKEFKLAVLGNIATHPQFRRKGNGHQVITYLLSKLKEQTDFIGLNVKADNVNAIKLYEALGFTTCIEYKEALFTKKENN